MAMTDNQRKSIYLFLFWRWQYINRNPLFRQRCDLASAGRIAENRLLAEYGMDFDSAVSLVVRSRMSGTLFHELLWNGQAAIPGTGLYGLYDAASQGRRAEKAIFNSTGASSVFQGKGVRAGEELIRFISEQEYDPMPLSFPFVIGEIPRRYVLDPSWPGELEHYFGVKDPATSFPEEEYKPEFLLKVRTDRPLGQAIADVTYFYQRVLAQGNGVDIVELLWERNTKTGEINDRMGGAAPGARAMGLLLYDHVQATGVTQSKAAQASWVEEAVIRLGLEETNQPDLERFCGRTRECVEAADVLPLKKKTKK